MISKGANRFKVDDWIEFPTVRPDTFSKDGRMDFLLGGMFKVVGVFDFMNGSDQFITLNDSRTQYFRILASDAVTKQQIIHKIINEI